VTGVQTCALPILGRVRARVLYNSGFTNISTLTKAPLQRLVEIPLIGPRLAKSIKEQVGGLVEEGEWERLKRPETEQRALTEFVEEKYEDERPD
jgi:hypothetical protein